MRSQRGHKENSAEGSVNTVPDTLHAVVLWSSDVIPPAHSRWLKCCHSLQLSSLCDLADYTFKHFDLQVFILGASATPCARCSPLRRCWPGGMPSLSWALALALSIASLASLSKVMVLPINVFAKICMPRRNRNRCRSHDGLPRSVHNLCRPFQDNCLCMVTPWLLLLLLG